MLHKRGGFSPSSSCTILPSSLASAVCLVCRAGVWGHMVMPWPRHTPGEGSPFVALQPHWSADHLHAPHPNSHVSAWACLCQDLVPMPSRCGHCTLQSSHFQVAHLCPWRLLLPGNCEQVWVGQPAGEQQPHLPDEVWILALGKGHSPKFVLAWGPHFRGSFRVFFEPLYLLSFYSTTIIYIKLPLLKCGFCLLIGPDWYIWPNPEQRGSSAPTKDIAI